MILPGLLLILGMTIPPQAGPPSLPLVVERPAAPASGTLAILVTGDGGWSHVDRTLAGRLAAQGDAVVGLNSLHYFQHRRTSTGMAADLTAIARAGCEHWQCRRIVLIGYSMGADVLPFVVDRLAPDVRTRVAQLDLVSLGHDAVFKFFPTQWLGIDIGQQFPTLPALAALRGLDIVCVYGTSDPDAACRDVPAGQAKIVPLPAGHIMSRVAGDLAAVLAEHVRQAGQVQPAKRRGA